MVKPDLPALDNGTPAGFLHYPASPKRIYDAKPATGGKVSFLKTADTPLAVPKSRNQYWQQLEKRVGAELDIQIVNSYKAKLATVIASGDLPDIVQLLYVWPDLPGMLKSDFEDLSAYLSGDAIEDYPSLAAIPSFGWQNVAIDDAIWGIPWTYASSVSRGYRTNNAIFDTLKLSADVADGKELLGLCKELTDAKHSRWAIANISTVQVLLSEMVGVPNQWKVDNGKFVADMETDEYKQMLDLGAQMWKSGYVYPDVASAGLLDAFLGGKIGIYLLSYTNWPSLAQRDTSGGSTFRQGGIVPPKWDGGGSAGHYLGSGVYTFTAVKKGSSKARTEELLRVADWFAAPFGSEEYLFSHYGVAGRDYTLSGSDPVPTSIGTQECVNMEMSYLATAPLPLYSPQSSGQTKEQYDYLSKLLKVTVPLPTVGLFSSTYTTKGPSVYKAVNALKSDILYGRKPVTDWDPAVMKWRDAGGDQIRHEYEEAYARAH